MDKQTKKIDDKKVRNNLLIFGLGGWFIIGLGLFIVYGHLDFLIFPIIIIIWFLVAFVLLCFTFNWSRWLLLLLPILAVVSFYLVIPLYWSYRYRVAKNAVVEFIDATANNNLPEKFSIEGEDLVILGDNVSLEYKIIDEDFFFGSYEWLISFGNGNEYRIVTKQDSLRQWGVSVDKN